VRQRRDEREKTDLITGAWWDEGGQESQATQRRKSSDSEYLPAELFHNTDRPETL